MSGTTRSPPCRLGGCADSVRRYELVLCGYPWTRLGMARSQLDVKRPLDRVDRAARPARSTRRSGYWVDGDGLSSPARGRTPLAPRRPHAAVRLEPLVQTGPVTAREIAAELAQRRARGTGPALAEKKYALGLGRGTTRCATSRNRRRSCASARCMVGRPMCGSEPRGFALRALQRRVRREAAKEDQGDPGPRSGWPLPALRVRAEFIGALHFHHVDPASKAFSLSRDGVTHFAPPSTRRGREMRATVREPPRNGGGGIDRSRRACRSCG